MVALDLRLKALTVSAARVRVVELLRVPGTGALKVAGTDALKVLETGVANRKWVYGVPKQPQGGRVYYTVLMHGRRKQANTRYLDIYQVLQSCPLLELENDQKTAFIQA
jgi:hypothetical protein